MQLVIIFMLTFVAFLALTLNFSKAFQMKNDVLTMIEKYEGVSPDSMALINNYLSSNGYHVKKRCRVGSYGITDLSSNNSMPIEEITESNKNNQYHYCIQKVASPSSSYGKKAYYKVDLFFYFNLPVIGDVFKFTASGSTNDVLKPIDELIETEE